MKTTTKIVLAVALDKSRQPANSSTSWMVPFQFEEPNDLTLLPSDVKDVLPSYVSLMAGDVLGGEVLLKTFEEDNERLEVYGDFGNLCLPSQDISKVFSDEARIDARIAVLYQEAKKAQDTRMNSTLVDDYAKASKQETMAVLRLAAAICNKLLLGDTGDLRAALEYTRDHLADDAICVERGDKLPF